VAASSRLSLRKDGPKFYQS